MEAGKAAFVEWPLGANVQQAEELTALAKAKGSQTIVGLQGRLSPVFLKVKELLASGKIGKLLSSSVIASSGALGTVDSVSESLAFFFDRSIGGNFLSIHFGHLTDSILNVLGPVTSITPHHTLQRPKLNVLSPEGEVIRVAQADVPDLINIHGLLASQANAPISITYRRAPPFKGTPGLIWSLVGEKGEIRVEGEGTYLHAFDAGVKVQVQLNGSEDVESVEWKNEMAEKGIQGPAANIGALYEAFAKGKEGSWPGFEQALDRHRMLEEVWGDWRA